MTLLALVLGGTLLALALWQTLLSGLFARLLWRGAPPAVSDAQLPFASILLPLRGADPQLAEGLRRLLQQDYPRYDLQIVVDRREDPAWNLVQAVVRTTGATNVCVRAMEGRSTACSPQCTALIQAVQNLSPESEVVVIIDGDVLTHPTWLRELVAPLLDEGVGIAHGNRWFLPRDANWGSLVRRLWNAGAVVPMHFLRIPWAGSLAMRKTVLFESGLWDCWPRAIVPDAPAKRLLARKGLRIQFVPAVMMVNREQCDLAFSHDFMKRQMTWTRLYHPHWAMVCGHAVLTSVALVAAFGLAVAAVGLGRFAAAGWAGGGLAAYLLAMLASLTLIEAGVRCVVRRRGETPAAVPLGSLCKLPWAIPLTQFVYLSAVLLATFRRRVTWRGITYDIRGPFDVTVSGDRPFEQASESAASNASL